MIADANEPINTAEAIVRILEQEGIKRIYGVPGEENEDMMFALEKSSITFVNCRHEQGAAFMANVHGRITGKAGACLATLGPGATNLLTGLADAQLDKAPVLAITAQGSLERLHHESHQIIDVVNIFKPITKWNFSINDPSLVPEVLRKAIKVAEMEKPGVCHVELPENIAAEKLSSFKILERSSPRLPAPDQVAVQQAVEVITQSSKVVILAGNGAIRNRASESLTALAQDFNIPVISTFMGKGAISDRLDQSLFAIGLGFRDYGLKAFEQAEVVMTVGYDIAEYDPAAWHIGRSKKIIHIDFTPAEVYQEYQPKVEITSDIANALDALYGRLNDQEWKGKNWYSSIRSMISNDLESYRIPVNSDQFTIPGVLSALREVLPDHGLVISDVGAHKMWIARNFPTYCPNGCIVSNGLASMGIALPGGIAASIEHPDRPIFAIMGDGGFMMNVQELETAVRVGAGYGIVVFVDDDYGLISWKQERNRGRSFGTTFGNPDFTLLAQSFGISVRSPNNVEDLKAIFTEVIKERKLTIIPIPVHTFINGQLVEKLEKFWQS